MCLTILARHSSLWSAGFNPNLACWHPTLTSNCTVYDLSRLQAASPMGDSSLILKKILSCHFASTWIFFPDNSRFLIKGHIDVGLLSGHRLRDSLSFFRFHDVILRLLELQISRTMGVEHVTVISCNSRVADQRANFCFQNSDHTLCVSC